jgi:hypothetical protein
VSAYIRLKALNKIWKENWNGNSKTNAFKQKLFCFGKRTSI